MRRVLVTGAAGFIGRRLVAALDAQGDLPRALLRRPGPQAGAGEWALGDVNAAETLAPAIAGCDAVVHCAHGGSDLAECLHVNVDGTRNVLEAASRAGVRRIVHLSTWRVHGRALPRSVDESLPLVERGNPYDVSKARAEQEAFAFAAQHGLELVVLRPTIVYGPGCGPWVDALVERLKYERLRLIGGGRGTANVVFVDDVVAAILCALRTRAGAGEAFLVSAARAYTWRDYLAPLCAALHKPLPASIPDWAAGPVAGLAHWHFRFTRRPPAILRGDPGLFGERAEVRIDRARERLGFAPRVDLAEGMAAVVRDLQARGLVGAPATSANARRRDVAPFPAAVAAAGDAAAR